MTQDSPQKFRVDKTEGVLVIEALGPTLDSEDRDELYAFVGRLAREPQPRRALLSLTGIHSIRSVAIGILVNFQKRIREAGGALKVSDIDPNVHQVLCLTKMDLILELHSTGPEAIAAFKGRTSSKTESAEGTWYSKFFGGES
jgi:anti-anti-sigma factor